MTSRLGCKSEKPHRLEDPYWSKRAIILHVTLS